MMASAPEYNEYAEKVLAKQLDPEVYAKIAKMEDEGDYENPEYMNLLMEHHYTKHILRKPTSEWPESINRTFKHLNPEVYVYMQGPSEFGIKGGATLTEWDIKDRLSEITVPTLVIGAQYDTMDPEHMNWMANEVQNGRFLLAPIGSHLTQYDDQEAFFPGLIDFLKDVDSGEFK
ncbi:MAG: proline iminopeptidase, partial [Flavobacteriaceae bacterium]|nr:proline iminopeptidase [Flavobacteriaceae bacterium]